MKWARLTSARLSISHKKTPHKVKRFYVPLLKMPGLQEYLGCYLFL